MLMAGTVVISRFSLKMDAFGLATQAKSAASYGSLSDLLRVDSSLRWISRILKGIH